MYMLLSQTSAWENSAHFVTPPLVSLQHKSEEWAQKFHTDDDQVTTQIWVALLIGHAAREICFNQPEALPRYG